MKKFTLGEKLNGIVYLQGYKDNPPLYAFLNLAGHAGIDVSRGDGDPLPAYYDGTVVHTQYDAIVYLTDPDENGLCLEISIAHGANQRFKVGDRIKAGDIICDQSTMGPSVGWGDFDRIAWSHEHIAFRYAKLVTGTVYQKLYWDFRSTSPINYMVVENDPTMEHFIDPSIFNQNIIPKFAEAIQRKEGWAEGTKAYVNNNPGNIRDIKGNFIKYASYEEGFAALCDYIERAIIGKHNAYLKWGKNMTVLQFFLTYAPKTDGNDPLKYAQDVVEWIGLKNVYQPMSDLLLCEFDYIKKYNNLSQGLVPHTPHVEPTADGQLRDDLRVELNPLAKVVLYLFNLFFKK